METYDFLTSKTQLGKIMECLDTARPVEPFLMHVKQFYDIIRNNDIYFNGVCGRGMYGTVYEILGRNKTPFPTPIVFKCITGKNARFFSEPRRIEGKIYLCDILLEIVVGYHMSAVSRHFVKPYGCYIYHGLEYIVMEKADKDLCEVLGQLFEEDTSEDKHVFHDNFSQILFQICYTIDQGQNEKYFLHGDLRIDNVLASRCAEERVYVVNEHRHVLNVGWEIKICDYNSSRMALIDAEIMSKRFMESDGNFPSSCAFYDIETFIYSLRHITNKTVTDAVVYSTVINKACQLISASETENMTDLIVGLWHFFR